MKLDKKQVPQLIVLGVLVLICIGYASFKMMSPGAPPPEPVQQPKQETTKAEDTAVSDKSEADFGVVPAGVFPNLTSTPSRRDPFIPVASLNASEIQTQQTARVVKPKPKPVVSNPSTRIPNMQQNPFNPFSRTSTATVNTEPVQLRQQDPEFTLTGAIWGQRNVAIIRSADGGRYVVKQGQLIDGRYMVESVSDDSATLVYKNRRIHVKLGEAPSGGCPPVSTDK